MMYSQISMARYPYNDNVTVLTTRPKGIARDIKLDIGAVVNTYQLKVLAARWITVMLDHHSSSVRLKAGLHNHFVLKNVSLFNRAIEF